MKAGPTAPTTAPEEPTTPATSPPAEAPPEPRGVAARLAAMREQARKQDAAPPEEPAEGTEAPGEGDTSEPSEKPSDDGKGEEEKTPKKGYIAARWAEIKTRAKALDAREAELDAQVQEARQLGEQFRAAQAAATEAGYLLRAVREDPDRALEILAHKSGLGVSRLIERLTRHVLKSGEEQQASPEVATLREKIDRLEQYLSERETRQQQQTQEQQLSAAVNEDVTEICRLRELGNERWRHAAKFWPARRLQHEAHAIVQWAREHAPGLTRADLADRLEVRAKRDYDDFEEGRKALESFKPGIPADGEEAPAKPPAKPVGPTNRAGTSGNSEPHGYHARLAALKSGAIRPG